MNSELVLNLLGNPVVEQEGSAVTGFQSSKVQALLYYLAVVGHPQSRSTLAALLWGDVAETHARRSLTAALSNLRRVLGDVIVADRERVAFRREQPYRLDVEWLETALETGDVEALRGVADLYRGEFLEGFYVRNTPDFELWVARERARLREQFMIGLNALAEHDAAAGNRAGAIGWTRRMVQIEPWREGAHRNLMRYLAQDDQRGAALAQFETCRKALADELGVEPDETTLALVEQIRAGRLRREPLAADGSAPMPHSHRDAASTASVDGTDAPVVPPPAVEPTDPPHNLLLQLTPFVGRRHDVDAIIQRLCDPDCHLLAVVGPGGIGKTRLALHVAHSLLNRPDVATLFTHGIYFVPLVAVTDRTELIAAVAEAVGLDYSGAEPPAAQLATYLAAKRMLLLLDNFEHLLDETAVVSDLLRHAPGLTAVLTSRESLHARDAWIYPLTGLAYPPTDRSAGAPTNGENRDAPAEMASYDAVQLFAQCASRARIGFELDDVLADVVRICRLADGLPLAIELSASWLRVMTTADIVAEIESGLDILVSRHHDIAERHRSMRVVLEQAWQMLAAHEQAIFARLSVFRGGFQRAAATAVAGASLMDLAVFVEKSLLQLTPGGRYQIHELLRQFAAEQLARRADHADTTAEQHSRYYLDYLAARADQLVGSEQQQALDEVEREIENVRTAWLWAVGHGALDALEGATDSLYYFYWVRRRGQEGREMFARTLAQIPAPAAEATAASPAMANDTIAARLRMNLLRKQGLFLYFLGDYGVAYPHLEASMDLARRLGARRELAYVLNITGSIAGWQGNITGALPQLREALLIARSLPDERAVSDNLQQLAQFTAHLGEFARASELAEESVRTARAIERPDLLGHALYKQGILCFYTGQYDRAEQIQRESHAIFSELAHSNGVSLALSGLSRVAWARGGAELTAARRLCQESLQIARQLGNRLLITRQLSSMAYICCDLGAPERAAAHAQEALDLSVKLTSKIYEIHALHSLGSAAAAAGKVDMGRTHLVRAITTARDWGLRPLLLLGLIQYAVLRIQEAAHAATASDAASAKAEALTLLALAEAHPACWHLFKVRAGRLRLTLTAELPDAAVMAATARAIQLTPAAIAGQIEQSQPVLASTFRPAKAARSDSP